MDVFSALQTSVSGLRAQAYALENISGNIANSQTVGFKRVDTNFQDMVPDLPSNRTVAGSVSAFSQLTNTVGGNIAATGIATNMAISGEGYFTVQARTGETNGQAVFGGPQLYTRRGDFALDKSGYLANGAGQYLKGASIDPVTGLSTGGSGVIKLSSTSLPPQATTTITYAANLPKTPTTPSGIEILTAPTSGSDPRILTGTGAAQVDASDASRFVSQSVSAGSFTAYDKAGSPVDVQMRWAKVAAGSGTTGDTWNLFFQNSTTATGTAASWLNVGTAYTFDTNGKLVSPSSGTTTIVGMAVDGTAIGDVSLNFGATGLTNYAASGGAVSTTTLQQNGYGAGNLSSFAVTSDGKITGSYSNGRTIPLAQSSIVQFKGNDKLKRDSGGVFEQTLESGPPITGLNGSTIIGGNVEQSNTDVAGEFSKIIITQQAYSANTKVMTTTQQMISDLLNVIR